MSSQACLSKSPYDSLLAALPERAQPAGPTASSQVTPLCDVPAFAEMSMPVFAGQAGSEFEASGTAFEPASGPAFAQVATPVPAAEQPASPLPQLPARLALVYAPERYLGGGAYGEVWLCRHKATGEKVALKMPRPGLPVEPDVLRRFLNEARVTANLTHPSIVRVKAHGIENGTPWIAYEYLGDVTIHQRLCREGQLTPLHALHIAVQVAGALEEAHSHGVIHRDLKPANIIEVRPGEFKIFDFGLAAGRRPYQMQTGANLIVGTPAYLAPEQIHGEGASESTDQFGLGLVVYQLLSGIIPQHDDDVGTLLRRRGKEVIPSLGTVAKDLPAQIVNIVDRMLSKNPAARFDSMRSARRALQEALNRLETPSMPRSQTRIARSSVAGAPHAAPSGHRPTPALGRARRLSSRFVKNGAAAVSGASPITAGAKVNALRKGAGIAQFFLAPVMIVIAAIVCWFRN